MQPHLSAPSIQTPWSRVFRSLAYRNFRLFWVGQGISLIGIWMQAIAVGWLAYELTAGEPERVRASWLGIVGFAGGIPTFVFASLGGALADRWNRRRVVLVTQSLALIQAALLATLTLTHVIGLELLILLVFYLGMINAVDIPARQSLMIETVEKQSNLSNAIALNSSMFNIARIIGPAIGGVLLKMGGAGFCFLCNAGGFLASITALLSLRLKPPRRAAVTGHIFKNIAEGARYAFNFKPIRNILLLLMVVSFSGASYPVLLPIFSAHVLGQGAGLYAWLFAGAGLGALVGAVFLAFRESTRGLLGWIGVAPMIFGLGLIVLGISRWVWLSLMAMPVIGFGLLVQTASSNTMLQTLVKDHMRGRVMSMYSMAFMGMMPFGSLLAGLLSRLFGAPVTVCLNGLLCIIGAVVFSKHRHGLYRQIDQPYGSQAVAST